MVKQWKGITKGHKEILNALKTSFMLSETGKKQSFLL